MIEIQHAPTENLVTIRASGQLTTTDYDRTIPELEEAIRKADGSLNAVIHVEALKGAELGALWKDLKFDVEHLNDFRRIAVVGEGKLQEVGTRASGLLTGAKVEFFEPDASDEARRWAAAA